MWTYQMRKGQIFEYPTFPVFNNRDQTFLIQIR